MVKLLASTVYGGAIRNRVAAMDDVLVFQYSKRHEFRLAFTNHRTREAMLDTIVTENGIRGHSRRQGGLSDHGRLNPEVTSVRGMRKARQAQRHVVMPAHRSHCGIWVMDAPKCRLCGVRHSSLGELPEFGRRAAAGCSKCTTCLCTHLHNRRRSTMVATKKPAELLLVAVSHNI